ncbi:MAG: HipA N-terminal domain-containing protein, partial [Propionibacteriaceae bacterium]|nr:HipA N-terminal domain-containing protein [Propionibacteriaceae bacterium]
MSERLAVLLSGEVVGHLERAGPGSDPVFAYTADYVRSGAVALSAALPISAARHSGKRLGAYLAGLLPESDAARAAWAGRLGVAADDVFGTLGQMGWDCAGAVQFCREGQLDELRSRAAEFEPIGEAEIAARLRGLADGEASWTLPGEHWSLGGQQQKLALARVEGRWHAAHGSAPTTHIIKPGIARLHHQALVEHATMAAAASVGVVAAPTAFERFEDQWAIVVRR